MHELVRHDVLITQDGRAPEDEHSFRNISRLAPRDEGVAFGALWANLNANEAVTRGVRSLIGGNEERAADVALHTLNGSPEGDRISGGDGLAGSFAREGDAQRQVGFAPAQQLARRSEERR